MTEQQTADLLQKVELANSLLTYVSGFLLFIVVVIVAHYTYKFLRIFLKKGVCTMTETTATKLAEVVTPEMMSGVLDQIVGLLPVVMPVMISFIALRKGISFVQGILQSA